MPFSLYLVAREPEGRYVPYVGPHFYIQRSIYMWSGATWRFITLGTVPTVEGVTLVKGSSVMDPNLELQCLVGVYPPTDKIPLILEKSTLQGLVKQGLSMFVEVLILFSLIYFLKYL